MEFYNSSVTVFEDNSGLHGGAILLIGGAWIEAFPNSTVVFYRNTAVISGAAIYVQLTAPFDYVLSHSCFIRYSEPSVLIDKWNTSFSFQNNTAGLAKLGVIFATTLRPCHYVYNNDLFTNEKAFCFYRSNKINEDMCLNSTSTFLTTSPVKFCNISDEIIHIVPGKVHDLNFFVVDELGNNINDTRFTAVCSGKFHDPIDVSNIHPRVELPYVLPTYQFTYGLISIAGNPNTTCQLELQTITDFQITGIFNILLTNCPPGFYFNNNSAQCECLTTYKSQNPAIRGCEAASFQASFNAMYWIGYESDSLRNLLMGQCPLGYCYQDNSSDMLLPEGADKIVLEEFVCKNRHRIGLLCGKCVDEYSVSLNSPTLECQKCKNNHFMGILYLFLSYITPVSILFYIIMAYNIRMTTAPIGAFLFFSQIIASHYHSHLVYSININNPSTLDTSNVLNALYSISNLVFFNHNIFSFCLFKRAGTADIKAFELLLSFYPVLLIIVYFFIRKYCHCLLTFYCLNRWRFSNSAISHGVCGFLILCFVRINLLAFLF